MSGYNNYVEEIWKMTGWVRSILVMWNQYTLK